MLRTMRSRSSTIRLAERRRLGAGRLGAALASMLLACCGAPRAPSRASTQWPCSTDASLARLCRESGGRDGDGDGWPDALEVFLGTNPASTDTDGDGTDDALDRCPLLADDGASQSPLAALLQEAVGAFPDAGPTLLVIPANQPRVCFDRLSGVQLHGRSGEWDYATLRFWVPADFPHRPAEGDEVVVEARLGGRLSGCTLRIALVYRDARWVRVRVTRTLCA